MCLLSFPPCFWWKLAMVHPWTVHMCEHSLNKVGHSSKKSARSVNVIEILELIIKNYSIKKCKFDHPRNSSAKCFRALIRACKFKPAAHVLSLRLRDLHVSMDLFVRPVLVSRGSPRSTFPYWKNASPHDAIAQSNHFFHRNIYLFVHLQQHL